MVIGPLFFRTEDMGSVTLQADGKEYVVPSTIDDPTVLASIVESAREIGYGRK
jgi:hypothetical protein